MSTKPTPDPNRERVILKWDIEVDDQSHTVGRGPVVHVACQSNPGIVQVWTEEYSYDPVTTTAQVFGTGHKLPLGDEIIGSAIPVGGALVWHILRKRL